jgi:hypothetical protein
VSAEDILSQPQPHPDERTAYGADLNQFLEVRLPPAKGPHPALLNIHGGIAVLDNTCYACYTYNT